jgi:hypothetical protein
LLARRIAAMDRLMALGEEMRKTYPDPDDGLTTSEWIRKDHEERTERIVRNAHLGESGITEE